MTGLTFTCRGATVRHGQGRVAIDGIDLEIGAGEQVALIGPSGAGKTTLLSVLGAALRPHEGQVIVGEADPWRLPGRQLRRLRASLFNAPQAPPLPPRQRVVTAVLAGRLGNWSLGRALWSLVRPGDPRQAFEALEVFSLGDRLWSRVDRLSGGERQRVSLARALVSPSRALLVDEPLSALDPALAHQTLSALIGHCRNRGDTLICSLHQVDMALEHFPRIVGLRDGRVAFDLPSAEVSNRSIRDLYFGHEAESDRVVVAVPRSAPVPNPMPAGRCVP